MQRLEEVENLKLLSMQPNTMQVILCKGEISGLDYFRGKKVRVWAKAMGDYMEELGSTTVTIPWEEALPALQSGVADCGITSPSNANNAHWWEVLDSQMVIPLGGWAISFFGANLDWWNGLDAETQALAAAIQAKAEGSGLRIELLGATGRPWLYRRLFLRGYRLRAWERVAGGAPLP